MHCLGQCSFTVQVDEFEHSLCSVLDILQQCSTVWWDDPHYVGTEAGCVMCHCVTYCPHIHHNRQQVPTSHNISHITNNSQAELQCGAAAGCYWLLGWFAVFRVSTVQSVNTGSLHCTALYCTVHMCSVHHTASTQGINPPTPTLQVSNSVNGHKLNYYSDTEEWL